MRRVNRLALVLCCSIAGVATATAAVLGQGASPVRDSVPADLRPLLAPHRGEMRLVSLRYNADRNLLAGNFAGGGGRRGGRGGGAPDTLAGPPVVVSPNRIARLKRFDLSWQSALDHLDASKFTPEARADLDSLRRTMRRAQNQLDDDALTLHYLEPALPFAPKLVGLIEARLRLENLDAEHAAGILAQITKEIGVARVKVDSGLGASATGWGLPAVGARQAARAVETLRSNLAAWYNFYHTYDPLFDWWIPLPYKHVDSALQGYVAFLQDTVTTQTHVVAFTMDPESDAAVRAASDRIPPAPAPKYSDVPDLPEIIALPQDELTDIVNRFFGRSANGGRGGGGGGGRGGNPGPGAAPAPLRDSLFYQNWLTALKTLDFDHLSRNAQVDYLYLKHVAELQVARQGKDLAANQPRKIDNTGIPGAARGREGLIRDLQDELIPYTPEQLMALADREFAWTEAEMLKASRQMGFGDNWKAAVEKVKTMHVPPGGQPGMIRDLIYEAIDYLRTNDLITVSEVASESQSMSMMSAQAQLANPFFLGGSQIQVSYPTDGMEFDAREQSMRGNNRPFSHATAFHEMIPGHNLQGYTNARYAGYRANLGAGGPFYGEGWALYWELILYDKGFDRTPEEKVGALFWRMHRCARIIFSLKFHMGLWSPQEAIDFLVDRVGHERDNATAEVRRSFQGGYGPLYQAAYLLGGLELRGLRKELVDSKQMTEKAFHDEILRQGSMPIGLLRLGMTKQKLTRDMPIDWKFYGELPDK